MDFKKLKKWQEWVRLILGGLIVMIAVGLLGPVIPAFFEFGFAFAGLTFSLGLLLTAGVSYFLAEAIVAMLKL